MARPAGQVAPAALLLGTATPGPKTAPAPVRTRRRWAPLLIALAVGLASLSGVWLLIARLVHPTLPAVAAIDLMSRLVDRRPLAVTIVDRAGRHPYVATTDDIRFSVSLWRLMHVADWNGVEVHLRTEAFDRMFARYRDVLVDPRRWDTMTAADWDDIPQPVRTVAYRFMTAYWSGYYGVGSAHGLDPRVVADTLAAIVMSESWFDHRGLLVNPDGSRDIGLGGASDYARERLRVLHRLGLVDIGAEDGAYENPWMATRFVAIWMGLLLDEAAGDLDLAVRAYNRGIRAASDDRGTAYSNTVRSRLTRFIRNQNAPPAWNDVWTRARRLERAAWPWIRPAPEAPADRGASAAAH